MSRDRMVTAIEKGEIDLNYLLEDVVDEIVVKVKQHALADLGNLTRAGLKTEEGLEPIQLSEMVLKGVGLTKPGPMLKAWTHVDGKNGPSPRYVGRSLNPNRKKGGRNR